MTCSFRGRNSLVEGMSDLTGTIFESKLPSLYWHLWSCWNISVPAQCECLKSLLFFYLPVFDDGDEKTLRRTSLCLKGERHFAESEVCVCSSIHRPTYLPMSCGHSLNHSGIFIRQTLINLPLLSHADFGPTAPHQPGALWHSRYKEDKPWPEDFPGCVSVNTFICVLLNV